MIIVENSYFIVLYVILSINIFLSESPGVDIWFDVWSTCLEHACVSNWSWFIVTTIHVSEHSFLISTCRQNPVILEVMDTILWEGQRQKNIMEAMEHQPSLQLCHHEPLLPWLRSTVSESLSHFLKQMNWWQPQPGDVESTSTSTTTSGIDQSFLWCFCYNLAFLCLHIAPGDFHQTVSLLWLLPPSSAWLALIARMSTFDQGLLSSWPGVMRPSTL